MKSPREESNLCTQWRKPGALPTELRRRDPWQSGYQPQDRRYASTRKRSTSARLGSAGRGERSSAAPRRSSTSSISVIVSLERPLARPDRHHPRALRLGHRQGQEPRLEQLDALVAEARRVHRILRVEPVRLDELRAVNALLPARAEQPLLLAVEIAEVAATCSPREQRRPQCAQLLPQLGPLPRSSGRGTESGSRIVGCPFSTSRTYFRRL